MGRDKNPQLLLLFQVQTETLPSLNSMVEQLVLLSSRSLSIASVQMENGRILSYPGYNGDV